MSYKTSALSEDRLTTMLSTALGSEIGNLILDDSIIELMLNPDGNLWIDRLGEGRTFTGYTINPYDAERVIYIVASSMGFICNKEQPLLSGELPGSGSRFQGILPPIASNPVFTIRKKAIKVFSLNNYVASSILSNVHCQLLKSAIQSRQNILIAGGTGSGKTTFANAVLDEVSHTNDRIIIIEDTQELQCNAKDCVLLRARDECASMTDLLRCTMRLRPDRIVIGEVRGPEALTLLKAWNTGHPGGCATVHADSAEKALTRIEQLVFEAGVSSAKYLISDAVDLVVFIEKVGSGRRVSEIIRVNGIEQDKYIIEKL